MTVATGDWIPFIKQSSMYEESNCFAYLSPQGGQLVAHPILRFWNFAFLFP